MFEFFKKAWANMRGNPYMSIKAHYRKNGSIGISAKYNKIFIETIDENYYRAGNEDYSPMMTDNEKCAFYMADTFDAILGTHQNVRNLHEIADEYQDDPYGNVPALGTLPVKQTVDIAGMSRATGRLD